MIDTIILISVIVLSVVIVIFYLFSGTKFDRLKIKEAKENNKEKQDDNKEKAEEENKDNDKVEDKKREVILADKEPLNSNINSAKITENSTIIRNDNNSQQEEIVKENVVQDGKDNEIKSNLEKSSNETKSLKQQIENLSPELKAILFTDIIKPKF